MKSDTENTQGEYNSSEKGDLIDEIASKIQNLMLRAMYYHSKSLKAEHLTPPSFFLIGYIHRKGPQNLSTLASMTGVTKPSITAIVDNLEKQGLVKRVRDENDRRKTAISLTPAALEKMDKFELTKGDLKRELSEALTIEQLKTLRETVSLLEGLFLKVVSVRLKLFENGEEYE